MSRGGRSNRVPSLASPRATKASQSTVGYYDASIGQTVNAQLSKPTTTVYVEPTLAVCNRLFPTPPCESLACPEPVPCPACPSGPGCPPPVSCPKCSGGVALDAEPLTPFVAERLSSGVAVVVPRVEILRGSNAGLWLVGAAVLAGVGTGAYLLGKRATGQSKKAGG